MIQTIHIRLSPEAAHSTHIIKNTIANKRGIPLHDIHDIQIKRRSIDARSRNIKYNLTIEYACYSFTKVPKKTIAYTHQDVKAAKEVHIIGAGPAGLFAALSLIEHGLKPVILERGKTISERKKDIAQLHQNKELNEESNYSFGEGGAGTFSDGKLYTRSKKKGNTHRILELLVLHGASEDILIDVHPHIGTDKLPQIIENIRHTILECGGEIHFSTHITGFTTHKNKITELTVNNGNTIPVSTVILASGHSARDVYYALHDAHIHIEAKPTAMGVRVEHPQEFINNNQYNGIQSAYLPPAEYKLTHTSDKGVYSFCMCPGGIIVPASTQHNQLVVNGMSNSLRNSPFANSGIVVSLDIEDYKDFAEHGVFAGLQFQEKLEALAYQNGGNNLVAPAQRIDDFIQKRLSESLPECSYTPGIISSPLHFWLPDIIAKKLQEAFRIFNKKIHGFSREGILVGVESRTSSPIRIPRDKDLLHHTDIHNLYPCGEGAGYAGGIVSSAIDGVNCSKALANNI
ncbi:MAG: FAD-dependent monooxygenase [Bacteroidales bacterium]